MRSGEYRSKGQIGKEKIVKIVMVLYPYPALRGLVAVILAPRFVNDMSKVV